MLMTSLKVLHPTALRVGENRLFRFSDVYWRSPELGDLWYNSSRLIMATPHPPSKGCWEDTASAARNLCARRGWGGFWRAASKYETRGSMS